MAKLNDNDKMLLIEASGKLNLSESELKTLDKIDDNKELNKKDKTVLKKIIKSIEKFEEKKYKVRKLDILKKVFDKN